MNRRNFLKFAIGAAVAAAVPDVFGEECAPQTEIATSAQIDGIVSDGVLTVGCMHGGTIKPGTKLSGCGISRDTFVIGQIADIGRGVGTYAIDPRGQFSSKQTMILEA